MAKGSISIAAMKQNIYYETSTVLSDCQRLPRSDEKPELFTVGVDPQTVLTLPSSLSAPSTHKYTHTHQNKQTKTSITFSSLINQISLIEQSIRYFYPC